MNPIDGRWQDHLPDTRETAPPPVLNSIPENSIPLSRSLFTAADLQEKESRCTPAELRYLGELAQALEEALRGIRQAPSLITAPPQAAELLAHCSNRAATALAFEPGVDAPGASEHQYGALRRAQREDRD